MATIDTDNILSRLSPAKQRLIQNNGGFSAGNPQKRYMWEISVEGRELNGIFFNTLRFYAKTVNIPQDSVEQINIKYMGITIPYIGMENNSHTINLTFWDDENLTVYTYFKQWKNLVKEISRGRAVSKRSVVSDIIVSLKDSTDMLNTCEFKFLNCFPLEIGEIPLDYETSDVIEIPVTFSFDDMEVST